MERDAVIVGAGVAGCAAAHALAEAGAEVLVIEAGPGHPLPAECRSIDLTAAESASARWWDGPYPAGRGLGGGSAVNGMVVQRPDAKDPAVKGLAADVDAVIEAIDPVVPPLGPLVERVSALSGGPPATTLDLPRTGFAVAALSIRNGRRRTAADVWLDASLMNLGVVAMSGVERLDQADALARRVIVAAGAMRSPAIVGVEPKPPQDHSSASLVFELPETLRLPRGTSVAAATGIWRSGDCQLLFMDHTGDSEEGRRHGAVIVTALSHGDPVDSGILLANEILADVLGRSFAPVTSAPARVAHACSTLAGLELPAPVVDASTLPALPTVNPMVAVAAHARSLARSLH